MDKLYAQFFTWNVFLFCFGVLVLTAIVKRVLNGVLTRNPHPSLTYYWKKVLLPILPLVVGGIAGRVMTKYPYPPLVVENGVRVFFGFSCGLFSGFLYSLAKALLVAKGVNAPDPLGDSEPPPPTPKDPPDVQSP